MNRRLLYLCLHPSARGQAASTHLEAMVAGLEERGWEVDVARVATPARAGPLLRVLRWMQVQLRTVPNLRRYDAVYVRSHPAALFTVALCSVLGVPTIQEVNGPDEDYFTAWPQLRRARWLVSAPVRWQLRRAAAVIAVTEGLRQWVAAVADREDAHVVPNGVDVDRFRPAVPVTTAPAEGPYVAFVGALAPWQGLPTLLAAAQHPDWPDGVTLVIAGDGQERDLVAKAQEASPERVRWIGAVPHDEVPGLLANAEAAFVTSADRHGTGVAPLKLYEAMAVGAPIVVIEVAGAATTVRDEVCGLVVGPGDPAAHAAAVRRLHLDGQLRQELGDRGRRSAVARHSWRQRAGTTAHILRRVVMEGDDR